MLQIPGSPFATPARQMFQEHIRDSIQEDHEGLDKFSRRNSGLCLANNLCSGLHVPGPAQV